MWLVLTIVFMGLGVPCALYIASRQKTPYAIGDKPDKCWNCGFDWSHGHSKKCPECGISRNVADHRQRQVSKTDLVFVSPLPGLAVIVWLVSGYGIDMAVGFTYEWTPFNWSLFGLASFIVLCVHGLVVAKLTDFRQEALAWVALQATIDWIAASLLLAVGSITFI